MNYKRLNLFKWECINGKIGLSPPTVDKYIGKLVKPFEDDINNIIEDILYN